MKKKRICVGYRPKTGLPVDKDGKLILVYEWAEVVVDDTPRLPL